MIKLNRKEEKRQLDFYMLCKTFQESGVNTEKKALTHKDNLKRNAFIQASVVILIGALIVLFFQVTMLTVLMFVIILLLYIISFTYRGRTYLQRYIDEIIKHPNFDPEIGGFHDILQAEETPIANKNDETNEALTEDVVENDVKKSNENT